MDAKQAYRILDVLSKGKSPHLEDDSVSFLRENHLIQAITEKDYQKRHSDSRRLEIVARELEECRQNTERYRAKAASLRRKVDSGWHKLWTSAINELREKNELSAAEADFKSSSEKFGRTESEMKKLEQAVVDIDNYIKIPGGYARISKFGAEMTERLGRALPRLKDISYEKFDKEFWEVNQAIEKKYSRGLSFYSALVKEGFSKYSEVVQFGLALSNMGGDFQEIYKRAMVINNYLYNQKWTSYERLPIVSAVAAQEGDIHKLKDAMVEMFLLLIEKGNSKGYATWSEAAACLKIKGSSAMEKFERYDRLQDALNERQWGRGTAATCYIASNLAQKEEDVVALAEQFRNLEKKIVERGRNDCIQSGIAALMLMDYEGTPDEKADRFNETFMAMCRYGWEKDTKYYAAAGIVSLVPWTVEENVKWLDDITERLKKEGYSNVTDIALPIICGGFRQAFKETFKQIPDYYGTAAIAAATTCMMAAASTAAIASSH